MHVFTVKIIFALLISAVIVLPSQARTGKQITFPIAEAMKESGLADEYREKGFEIYWADEQPTRAIEKEIEEDNFTKSANKFLRSEKGACHAAFEELIEKLIDEMEERGANAMIGMSSFHDELPDYVSKTDFRCDFGSFRAVVGFRFRFVKLAPP